MRALKIREVFIGKVEEITGESAVQQRLDGEVWLGSEGLPGDTLGRRHHPGDSDRALLHYPAEHYRHWRKRFAFNKWRPAACGENFSAFGLLEEAVCVGDLWRWGEALLEVSQPHLPDYRLAQRWNLPELPRLLQGGLHHRQAGEGENHQRDHHFDKRHSALAFHGCSRAASG